jgi:hypothetical protein
MKRPTVEQLTASPELATLAVLDAALGVAIVALVAAWPELNDLEANCPHDEPRTALDVVQRAGDLAGAINRYRLALATADRRKYDLPF